MDMALQRSSNIIISNQRDLLNLSDRLVHKGLSNSHTSNININSSLMRNTSKEDTTVLLLLPQGINPRLLRSYRSNRNMVSSNNSNRMDGVGLLVIRRVPDRSSQLRNL
jgi:hypothetical protein